MNSSPYTTLLKSFVFFGNFFRPPSSRAEAQRSRRKEEEQKFSPRPLRCKFKKLFIFGKIFRTTANAKDFDRMYRMNRIQKKTSASSVEPRTLRFLSCKSCSLAALARERSGSCQKTLFDCGLPRWASARVQSYRAWVAACRAKYSAYPAVLSVFYTGMVSEPP